MKKEIMKWLKPAIISVVIFVLVYWGMFSVLPKTHTKYITDYEEQERVIVTETGECYHYPTCHYLHSSIPMGLEQAKSKGYRACSYCGGKTSGVIDVEIRIPQEIDITPHIRNESLLAASAATGIYIVITVIYEVLKKRYPDKFDIYD